MLPAENVSFANVIYSICTIVLISKSTNADCGFQNLKLVPVPKDQYGSFYEGDSYIIFAASEYGKYIGPGVKVSKISLFKAIKIHQRTYIYT